MYSMSHGSGAFRRKLSLSTATITASTIPPPRPLLTAAAPSLTSCVVVLSQRRYQSDASSYSGASSAGGARRVGRGYENPLAAKDPALRSVTVPDNFHGDKRNKGEVSSVVTAHSLHLKARKSLMQQLASNTLWRGTVVEDKSHWVANHFLKCRNDPKYRNSKERVVLSGRYLMRELADAMGAYPTTMLVTDGSPLPSWIGESSGSRTKTSSSNIGDQGNDLDGVLKEETADGDERSASGGGSDSRPSHETVITPLGKPCEIIRVSQQLANEIDPANDGYIGDYAMPAPPPIEDLIANPSRHERVLVLDNVSDPGQLGTMLRTAAALNYDAILMVNHCADFYNHAVVRASRGVHFLPHAPFYVVREEDGDDTYGLINHIINRNDMESVAFTPNPASMWGHQQNDSPSSSSSAPSPFAAARQLLKKDRPQVSTSAPSSTTPKPITATPGRGGGDGSNGSAAVAARLSTFLLDTFATGGNSNTRGSSIPSTPAPREKSFMVFAGPDHTRSLIPTLERKVIRPTTVLQLDEQQSAPSSHFAGIADSNAFSDDALAIADFSTTFPTVLYAMRPKGDWDFLTPAERENTELANKTPGVHVNSVGWKLTHAHLSNLNEEEQAEKAMDAMLWKVNKRALRRVKTDHGHFIDMQRKVHQHQGKRELTDAINPLYKFTGRGREFFSKPEPTLPADIPNITTDYMEHIGRDELSQQLREHDKRFTNWMDDVDGATEVGTKATVTDIYNQKGKFAYVSPNGARRAPR